MDRKTLLAMFICMIIFFGWEKWVIEPRIKTQPSPTHTSAPVHTTEEAALKVKKFQTTTQYSKDSEQKQSILTRSGQAILKNTNSMLVNWSLKNYQLGIAADSSPVDLLSVTHDSPQITLAFDSQELGYIPNIIGKNHGDSEKLEWHYDDSNININHSIIGSSEKYYLDIEIKINFKKVPPRYAFLYLTAHSTDKDPEIQDRKLVYWTNQEMTSVPLKEVTTQKEITTPTDYIGIMNRYFIAALIPQQPWIPHALIQTLNPHQTRISLVYFNNSPSMTIPVQFYFGPKDLEILKEIKPTLDHSIEFGWFSIIAYPLLKTLRWLNVFSKNYGISIILLTLLLKLITYPLTYKSMKSMKKMSKIQPQLQKIKEKYQNDREMLNREMLMLMRNHGYNPVAGCLPMLLQMPIFYALYRVLYSSIELYHAPFAGWIRDLSSHDPYYVTPILLSITLWVQQKLTPTTTADPTQAKVMQFMPLIFGAFMIALPSGLTLYMLVNAGASILQQYILNKKLGTQLNTPQIL